MLDNIIHFSIKNKLVIGLFTIALIAWGGYSMVQLPIDAVPDITNNQAQIITTSPSLAAQEIEQLVTFPIEQTMATIPDIVEIRSLSRFGLSIVTIVFKDDVDIYWARQQVSERLVEAKSKIPPSIGVPQLAPVTTGLGEIYQYTLRAKKGYEKKYDIMELRSIQDWIVRRQLIGVKGVADVSSFGGYLKQYEIALSPLKLRSVNISINEVFNALQKNNQNSGGAYIDKNPNTYFIRSEGLIKSLSDIENIVIKNTSKGIPILIRDIGKVGYGYANRFGAMTYDDKGETVGAIVLMLKGENSNKVITHVKERIEQIEKNLPEGVMIEPYLDRSKLVDRAIGTVETNLLEGALIVLFVLILFLGNLRAGLVVASVIPLSMLFAISMMNLFGVSGNLMSLGAIDFGLIVDGAIIIVEATLHQLIKRKGQQLTGAEMDEEVYLSAKKIRSSAAFGEIIILIVYLPILALVGIEGKMFGPMAQTVSFAILGAFILSLTYVPMISSLVLSKKITHQENFSDKLLSRFQKIYDPIIHFALQKKKLVLSLTITLFVASLIAFLNMGGEFMPTLEEGDFAVETRVLTGSSMQKTIESATKAATILKAKFPEIKSVIGKFGSSEIPTDPMPVEACDLMIILKDKNEWTSADTREELTQKMAETLKDIPGVTFGFQQPIQMRFNELMSGSRQDVAIKIFGEDLNQLTHIAQKVNKVVETVKGAEDIYVEEVSGLPQIVVHYHRDKIAQFGLNIEDINKVVQTSFAGECAGVVYEGEKRFDLVLRLEKENRKSIENVQNVFITTPNGTPLPLSQVADVKIELGPNQIQREDTKRRLTVGFNVRERDVESIVEELQQKIDHEVIMPAGYYIKYGGQFENLQEAKSRLSVAVPVALILILVLLYFTFKSMKQSLLVFSAIPLSAIGGVFALIIRDMPFSISAGVGFIALFGVSVLNGIVLIAEFNRLKNSGITDVNEIVLTGTKIRLRPVLMTALVASLGFIPMALSNGAGGEVQKPLATVVIGGLVSATFLTLVLIPILYILIETKMKTKKINSALLLFFFLLMGINFAHAQENNFYSVEKCMEEALKNNPSIKSGMYTIDLQNKLKLTSTNIGKTNVQMMYGQYNSSARNDNNFSVNQSIPFPTTFSSNLQYHNAQIKGSEYQLQITKNELQYKVKSAFGNLQYLLSYEILLQKQDSIFSEFSRTANIRYQTGEATLLEKTSADCRAQELKNLLAQNKSNIEIAFIELRTLMNSENNFSIHADNFKIQELNLATSDSSAYSNNPALNYFKQQIEIAELETKMEKSKMLPDINVGYFNQTLIGTPMDNNTYFANANNRFQGVQVGVTIPLWFVPQVAKIEANKINSDIAKSNYELEFNKLKSQYQQMIQEYLKLKSTLEYFSNTQLPQSDLIASHSQKAFKQGEISYHEHAQNLIQSIQIKSNYLNTLNQYNQTIFQIQLITSNN